MFCKGLSVSGGLGTVGLCAGWLDGLKAVLAMIVGERGVSRSHIDEGCGCLVSQEGASIVVGRHERMGSGGGRIVPTKLLTNHRYWSMIAGHWLTSILRLSNQLSRWDGERTSKPISRY